MKKTLLTKESNNMKSSSEKPTYTPKDHLEAAASQLLNEGKKR